MTINLNKLLKNDNFHVLECHCFSQFQRNIDNNVNNVLSDLDLGMGLPPVGGIRQPKKN